MPRSPDRADVPDVRIPCEICRKEIHISEALVAEAEDYVLYFCGIECFDQWRKQARREYGRDKPGV